MSKPVFGMPDPAPPGLTSEYDQPSLPHRVCFAVDDRSSAQDKLESI
jgi:hypothetical protein